MMTKKTEFAKAWDGYMKAAANIQKVIVEMAASFADILEKEGKEVFEGRKIPAFTQAIAYMDNAIAKANGDTKKRAEVRRTTIVNYFKQVCKFEVSKEGVVRFITDVSYGKEWLDSVRAEQWDAKLEPVWSIPEKVSTTGLALSVAKSQVAQGGDPDWDAILISLKADYAKALKGSAFADWKDTGIQVGKLAVDANGSLQVVQ